MRSLDMPFHEILSDEVLAANVTAVGPESAVACLVPFALVFAQEPQRTGNCIQWTHRASQSGNNKPDRASKGSLPDVSSDMNEDMVSALVSLIASNDITSKVVQELPAVRQFSGKMRQPCPINIAFGVFNSEPVCSGYEIVQFDAQMCI